MDNTKILTAIQGPSTHKPKLKWIDSINTSNIEERLNNLEKKSTTSDVSIDQKTSNTYTITFEGDPYTFTEEYNYMDNPHKETYTFYYKILCLPFDWEAPTDCAIVTYNNGQFSQEEKCNAKEAAIIVSRSKESKILISTSVTDNRYSEYLIGNPTDSNQTYSSINSNLNSYNFHYKINNNKFEQIEYTSDIEILPHRGVLSVSKKISLSTLQEQFNNFLENLEFNFHDEPYKYDRFIWSEALKKLVDINYNLNNGSINIDLKYPIGIEKGDNTYSDLFAYSPITTDSPILNIQYSEYNSPNNKTLLYNSTFEQSLYIQAPISYGLGRQYFDIPFDYCVYEKEGNKFIYVNLNTNGYVVVPIGVEPKFNNSDKLDYKKNKVAIIDLLSPDKAIVDFDAFVKISYEESIEQEIKRDRIAFIRKIIYNQQWDPNYEIVKGYLISVIDGIHKGSIIANVYNEYNSIYKNVVTTDFNVKIKELSNKITELESKISQNNPSSN